MLVHQLRHGVRSSLVAGLESRVDVEAEEAAAGDVVETAPPVERASEVSSAEVGVEVAGVAERPMR